ncbi:serine-rich protein [Scheffersomyces xylosifermentans]|uniref:serine-rich protein n=1 Tax=Scheffersomyces xylosifermentans TaxID=1304137 RepID=UPI00315D516E
MFNRRKSRSVSERSYTGVNHVAPSANQPSSNALAAALTIGKKDNNKPAAPTSLSSVIPRSNSMQFKRASPQQQSTPHQQTHQLQPPQQIQNQSSRGSLLKRNSTVGLTSHSNTPQSHHEYTASHNGGSSATQSAFRNFSGGSLTSSSSRSSLQTPGHSKTSLSHPVIYDIDDSFNDSYLDEITEESTQIYLKNQDKMRDLKLSHKPASNNNIHNIKKKTSNGAAVGGSPVKMVKKYIPTPNGIKIVEVPEANFQKEVARNNSMRSGANIPRSASLRGLSSQKKISRSSSLNSVSSNKLPSSPMGPPKKPSSRLSSLVKPKMAPMTENVGLESTLGKEDEQHEQALKMSALQKEIEHEKKLARELEQKRKEYEELKAKRLENERALLSLKEESRSAEALEETPKEATQTSIKDIASSAPSNNVVPVITTSNTDLPAFEEPIAEDLGLQHSLPESKGTDATAVSPAITAEKDLTGASETLEDITRPTLTTIELPVTDGSDIEGTVDNVARNQLTVSKVGGISADSIPHQENEFNSTAPGKTSSELYSSDSETDTKTDLTGTELGIISQYGNLQSSELLKRDSMVDHLPSTDEGDIEDNDEEGSNLAKKLRASYGLGNHEGEQSNTSGPSNFVVTQPLVEGTELDAHQDNENEEELPKSDRAGSIGGSTITSPIGSTPILPAESSETLKVPVAETGGSSSSSLYTSSSRDSTSKAEKKKLKSAMKNSSTQYNSSKNSAKSNAAHQAYLSLTTAENTRLNSKLSSSQLNDISPGGGNGGYPQPVIPAGQKRLSQSTLRKSQQQLQPPSAGLTSRSLRPQSMQPEALGPQGSGRGFPQEQHPAAAAMSGRSLRDRGSSYVQPIAPHPALQPNYQSPSKLKAAELYAKANSRPQSVFKPVAKRSSFSKESSGENPLYVQQGNQARGSRTLRDSAYHVPPPQQLNQQHQLQQQHQQHPQTQQPAHRTLRAEPVPQQPSNNAPVTPRKNGNIFKSRFVDSDEEDSGGHVGGSTGGGFKSSFRSRFNDSDEAVHIPKPAPQTAVKADVPTLRSANRDVSGASTTASTKEKRKFGGKLRKLFGRSDQQ